MSDSPSSGGAKLGLGLVGFGAAARMTLPSLTTEGNFDLVGAAESDPLVREAFAAQWGVPTFPTIEELIGKVQLDAVYIATPSKYHESYTIEALRAGLHVLVEKPMALTIESAIAMIDAARSNDRLLLENHKRSVDRPIITMWKLIEAGLTGQLQAAHRWNFSSWFYRPRAEEERDPSTGGVVLRQGAHEFDILRLLTQSEARRVSGWTGDYDAGRPGEGAYQASVDFANGVRATSVYSGYDHFDSNEFTLGLAEPLAIGQTWRKAQGGTDGVDEGEVKRRTIDRPGEGALRPDNGLFGFTLLNGGDADARPAPTGNVLLYGSQGRREFTMPGPSGTDLIAREFHDAIAYGQQPLHDGRWGLAVLEICLAVRRSAELGGAQVGLSHQYAVPDSTIAGIIGERDLLAL